MNAILTTNVAREITQQATNCLEAFDLAERNEELKNTAVDFDNGFSTFVFNFEDGSKLVIDNSAYVAK